MTTPKTYGNFINGEWIASATGKTFAVHNPARKSDLVAHFQASGPADMDRAVTAAQGAFDGWARTPAPKRASFLRKAGEILARRREEAATLLTREEGKQLAESRGEVDRAVALLEFNAGQGALLNGETFPSMIDG